MKELAEETDYSLASVSNRDRQLEPSGFIARRTKPGYQESLCTDKQGYFKGCYRIVVNGTGR